MSSENRAKEEMRLWAEYKGSHEIKYPSETVVRYLNNNFPTGKGKKIWISDAEQEEMHL